MTAEENLLLAVDSLVANEFEVELEGEPLRGIFRVTGLVTLHISESGERIHPPFELAKMVQRDGNSAFSKWLRESRTTSGSDRPRRTLTIVAIDDGTETRRWTVHNAWIGQVRYSAFDTASSDMVEEIVTLHYEAIEESWPATPDLQ